MRLKVYVAGKTQAIAEVRVVQGIVKRTGHTVSHDWTKVIEQEGGDVTEVIIDPETKTKYAQWDMEGVRDCDLLVAVGHPRLSGTLWECGAAAVLGKLVWLLRWETYGRVSIFEDLPNVERLDVQTMGERLWDYAKLPDPPTGTPEAMAKVFANLWPEGGPVVP